jgi:glucose/arabinose dehydrogenase
MKHVFARLFARCLFFFALLAACSQSLAASCQYIIQSEWSSGFTAAVRITNNGSAAINGWDVAWQYSDGTTLSGTWNATVTGTNPYTAKPLSWNSVIAVGQSVEVGMQGVKPAAGGAAVVVPVSGSVCGVASSVSSSPRSSSAASLALSSMPASSRPASSAPLSSTPLSSRPASSMPLSSAPASSRPASSAPLSSTPASSKPASSVSPSSRASSASPVAIALQRVFPNVVFTQPTGFFQAPGDANRWFVLEKAGMLYWLDATNNATTTKNVYIDLTPIVDSNNEGGLLGMTFHPNYASNHYVYLSFTETGTTSSVSQISYVARYTEAGGSIAASTRFNILNVDQPFNNHDGGHIAFGPDGFLYIGFGDGGSGNDPFDNGQDTYTWLGKFLRVDVNGGSPYAIPASNPFATTGGLPEIFAYGMRNPWRWSFDMTTGNLWAADVGEGRFEEIDLIVNGGNYGWHCKEGLETTTNTCTTTGPYIDPVMVYGREVGEAVTGGYVYRGKAISGLVGHYVFGDYANGKVWYLSENTSTTSPLVSYQMNQLVDSTAAIAHFGQANDGELYVVDYGAGGLYKIVPASVSSASAASSLRSSTASASLASSRASSTPASSIAASSMPASSRPNSAIASSQRSSAGSAAAALGCTLVSNVWTSGYQVIATVTNKGSAAISSWRVVLTFPQAPVITSSYSANITVSGNTVIATNLSWNGNLAVNGIATFGIQGTNGGAAAVTCATQ